LNGSFANPSISVPGTLLPHKYLKTRRSNLKYRFFLRKQANGSSTSAADARVGVSNDCK
jgi:hypothetical protein